MSKIIKVFLLGTFIVALFGCRPEPTPGVAYMIAPPKYAPKNDFSHHTASSHDFYKQ